MGPGTVTQNGQAKLESERIIKVGSLRSLYNGCELSTKLSLLLEIKQRFGLDFQALPVQYPFDRYLEMVEWLRPQLYPQDSVEVGFEKIGRNITKSVFTGPTGTTLKISAAAIGVEIGIPLFFRILGHALKFAVFDIVEQPPRTGYIKFRLLNTPGSPDLTRGMVLEAMDATRAINSTITYHKLNQNDTEFEVRWQLKN